MSLDINLPSIHDQILEAGRQKYEEKIGELREQELVNHPKHYNSHPSGVEAIVICEHMTFNVGNAMKYLFRAGLKSPDAKLDINKAIWYLQREVERISK